jgi:hypothetical protein
MVTASSAVQRRAVWSAAGTDVKQIAAAPALPL